MSDSDSTLVTIAFKHIPIQENVFTVSLPETEEFSVESAPVESAPVVRLDVNMTE
ncbi:hypothetical protein MFLAVUS_011221 [Mucor flavus]|uniref:Uncharacterized protein n=1 Tax=Mucor flavus TaxID=439312 RepID=A0ABP9ZEY2_9FUNG